MTSLCMKTPKMSITFWLHHTTISENDENVIIVYVLRDCETSKLGYDCVSTCDSVWFKIWNATAAGPLTTICDKAFIGRYANVMYERLCKYEGRDHHCRNGTFDRFAFVKKDINTQANTTVFMSEVD